MSPERWRQVEQLYQAVLEKDRSKRAAFLFQAIDGDEELHHEIECLLAQKNLLDGPAWQIAQALTPTALSLKGAV